MATQNSVNTKITNNADGYDQAGGTTPRKLTTTGADVTLTGSGTNVYTFPAATCTLASQTTANTFTSSNTLAAGTTSLSPLTFQSGTNLTSASAGAMEYDGKVFYSTPVASARGVSPSTMYSIVASAGFALSTAAGVQACFATTGDVWTLAASTTYIIEGHYIIQEATNAVSVALAFALGGSASVTDIKYFVSAMNSAANTLNATNAMTEVTQVASTVVTASLAGNKNIFFKGLIRMNVGGTVTPQINFSGTAAGTPTMLATSYIMFTPIGTDTNNIIGNVG